MYNSLIRDVISTNLVHSMHTSAFFKIKYCVVETVNKLMIDKDFKNLFQCILIYLFFERLVSCIFF